MFMGVYSMSFPAVPGRPEQKTLCPDVTICKHPYLGVCVWWGQGG